LNNQKFLEKLKNRGKILLIIISKKYKINPKYLDKSIKVIMNKFNIEKKEVIIEEYENLPEELQILIDEIPYFLVYKYNKEKNEIKLLFSESGYILDITN